MYLIMLYFMIARSQIATDAATKIIKVCIIHELLSSAVLVDCGTVPEAVPPYAVIET
jgi:hypothetical protein